MGTKFVIIAKSSVGTPETLFWNNNTGWGSFETATSFTRLQRYTLHLPVDGIWVPRNYYKRGGKYARPL